MGPPGHHEDRVGGRGERAVVVEAGGGAGNSFARDAHHVHSQPAPVGVQARGERRHECAERTPVAGAIVLEIQVEPRVGGIAGKLDEPRKHPRPGGSLREDAMHERSALATEARHLDQPMRGGVSIDFSIGSAHHFTARRAFEVGRVHHPDRPDVRLQVDEGVGRAREQEGLELLEGLGVAEQRPRRGPAVASRRTSGPGGASRERGGGAQPPPSWGSSQML